MQENPAFENEFWVVSTGVARFHFTVRVVFAMGGLGAYNPIVLALVMQCYPGCELKL